MIAPATRALGRDALYQVLDNGVFRILAFAALLPVLFFTLVQITPDEIRVLFGTWSWTLDELAEGFPALRGVADMQEAVVGTALDVLVFELGGKYGVLFCIAATAFFVPRLLEKGSADVLFHKPVSRLRFYLSRYVAGLLFVFLLALVSCTGSFLALAVFSRFVDPGIFVMAFALAYVFALVFPVAMLVGVLTRSTVAAVLLTSAFFLMNGCVHQFWIGFESNAFQSVRAEVRVASEEAPSDDLPPAAAQERSPDDEAEGATEGVSALSALGSRLRPAFDALHFVLPKTSDTPVLASKLRRAARRPSWALADSTLQLGQLPEEWRTSEQQAPGTSLVPPALDADGVLGPTSLTAVHADGAALALHVRPAGEVRVERANGTTRVRDERITDAAERLVAALRAAGAADAEEASDELSEPSGLFAETVTWTDPERPELRGRAVVMKADGRIVTLVHRSDEPLVDDPGLQAVTAKIGFGDPESAYGRMLTFDAPFRTNILQSVGTSLAFAVLVLALGAWRLSRIDF